MKDKSLGGAVYFVTFIDDFARNVWCFALKSKDHILDVFKDFHNKVEKEIGKQLKYIRADNDSKYREPFENYCKSRGIRLEKIVPETPKENKVVEKINRSIIERIRCMLSNAKLPKSFWG